MGNKQHRLACKFVTIHRNHPHVEPLIAEFSHRHPEVIVELGLNDAQLDLIAGSWDLTIRIGQLADSPLQTRQLGVSCMVVCAAPEYLDRRGVPRTVGELAQHNCLSYTLSAMRRHLPEHHLDD